MPAVQETIERVRQIDLDQYKYGFVTDIEFRQVDQARPANNMTYQIEAAACRRQGRRHYRTSAR